MPTLNRDLGQAGEEDGGREGAIRTFLYLGERIRSLYRGDRARAGNAAPAPPVDASGLLQSIEREIIPRLLLAHRARSESSAPAPDAGPRLTVADHGRFLEIIMLGSADAPRAFVEGLLRRGLSLEVIFLDLLTGAARRLGEMWEEDLCDFSDVTIGLCRLHQILREQSVLYENGYLRTERSAPRILLATACGDQHVFGAVVVAEFFRRAGWRVWSEPGASPTQLASLLEKDEFDVLGLSAACSAVAADVGAEISALRRVSRNRGLRVLVGGRLFVDEPRLAADVGADSSATDARQAPEAARDLLSPGRARC